MHQIVFFSHGLYKIQNVKKYKNLKSALAIEIIGKPMKIRRVSFY
jgi:hypothetical protein